MADDEQRRAILARRARLVTAALASAGLVAGTANCGGDSTKDSSVDAGSGGSGTGGFGGMPQPCLAAEGGGFGGTGGTPQPCLSGAGGWEEPPDASLDTGDAPDAEDAAGGADGADGATEGSTD